MSRNALIAVAVVLAIVAFVMFGGGVDYTDKDVTEVDVAELTRVAEKLLADSEAWETELEDGTVKVATSLEPHPIRTIRYEVEMDAPFEEVVAMVRDENHCGPGRRDRPELDKWEETMWQDGPQQWVRRSVHIAPPPGGNRDAVVIYIEDRPDENTYRTVFESVESLDGKPWPEVEGAVRFKVMPSIYKVEEIRPGRVRVRKVEAVDPRGAFSIWFNNNVISKIFFRRYMFEQAQAMRDHFEGASTAG